MTEILSWCKITVKYIIAEKPLHCYCCCAYFLLSCNCNRFSSDSNSLIRCSELVSWFLRFFISSVCCVNALRNWKKEKRWNKSVYNYGTRGTGSFTRPSSPLFTPLLQKQNKFTLQSTYLILRIDHIQIFQRTISRVQ